jgi:hypothetical protein
MEPIEKGVDGELFKDESWRAYEGLLGEVVHIGQYFFAWRNGCRIGRYDTLREAMEVLSTLWARR